MSKALRDLTDEELDGYCTEIARSAEAARVVGINVKVIDSAATAAAAETANRWGLA